MGKQVLVSHIVYVKYSNAVQKKKKKTSAKYASEKSSSLDDARNCNRILQSELKRAVR